MAIHSLPGQSRGGNRGVKIDPVGGDGCNIPFEAGFGGGLCIPWYREPGILIDPGFLDCRFIGMEGPANRVLHIPRGVVLAVYTLNVVARFGVDHDFFALFDEDGAFNLKACLAGD